MFAPVVTRAAAPRALRIRLASRRSPHWGSVESNGRLVVVGDCSIVLGAARPLRPVQFRLWVPIDPGGSPGKGRVRSRRQRRCNTALGRTGGRFRTVPFPPPRVDPPHRPPGGFPTNLAGGLAPRIGPHAEGPRGAFDRSAMCDLVRLPAGAIKAVRPDRLQWRHRLMAGLPKFLW